MREYRQNFISHAKSLMDGAISEQQLKIHIRWEKKYLVGGSIVWEAKAY